MKVIRFVNNQGDMETNISRAKERKMIWKLQVARKSLFKKI